MVNESKLNFNLSWKLLGIHLLKLLILNIPSYPTHKSLTSWIIFTNFYQSDFLPNGWFWPNGNFDQMEKRMTFLEWTHMMYHLALSILFWQIFKFDFFRIGFWFFLNIILMNSSKFHSNNQKSSIPSRTICKDSNCILYRSSEWYRDFLTCWFKIQRNIIANSWKPIHSRLFIDSSVHENN